MEKVKFFDPYPDTVIVGDKIYDIDLSFATVVQVWDVQSSDDFTDKDKIELQAKLFLDDPADCPETIDKQIEFLQAVYELFPKQDNDGERYIDFHQDAAMIRSGFFRIGVDLTKDRIHFFQFLELLADLPTDTAMMRTIKLRSMPLPKRTEHNAEYIAELQRAKARVAIKYSEEERRRRFERSLMKLRDSFLFGGR